MSTIQNKSFEKNATRRTVDSSNVQYTVGGYLFEELSWAERYRKTQIKTGSMDTSTKIWKIRSESSTTIKELRTQVK
jgi:hypothetical protein